MALIQVGIAFLRTKQRGNCSATDHNACDSPGAQA